MWLRLLEFSQFNEPLRWERERNKHLRSHKVRFKRSSRSQFVSRFNKIFCVLVHNLIFQTKPNHNRMKIFRSKIYAHCPFLIPSAQKSTLLRLLSSSIQWNEWKRDIQQSCPYQTIFNIFSLLYLPTVLIRKSTIRYDISQDRLLK